MVRYPFAGLRVGGELSHSGDVLEARMKLVPAWITSPRSTPRGWLVGIGLGFLAYAILLPFRALFAAHEWVLLVLFGIAYWVGCVAYEHPNPVTGMRNIA